MQTLRIELAWMLLTVCSIAGLSWLSAYLWIFALAPMALCALVGLIIVAVRLWQARLPELRRVALVRATVLSTSMVALVLGFPALKDAGGSLFLELRFHAQRSDFDLAVALELGDLGDAQLRNRLQYLRDEGPPLRLAFPLPGGIIDNWCGTVFDASGSVMQINQPLPDATNWGQTSREDPRVRLRKLFGGDMTRCRKLHAPYYFCCFT